MKNLVRVRFEVTERDIKKGRISDGDNCPVAIAVRRSIKPSCFENVGSEALHLSDGGDFREGFEIDLPKNVVKRIEKFDSRDGMSPFAFTMRLPQEVLRPSVLKYLTA